MTSTISNRVARVADLLFWVLIGGGGVTLAFDAVGHRFWVSSVLLVAVAVMAAVELGKRAGRLTRSTRFDALARSAEETVAPSNYRVAVVALLGPLVIAASARVSVAHALGAALVWLALATLLIRRLNEWKDR